MKSVSFNRNTSKGFSLIELLLVLGVLAILLVAAFVVYPQVRDRNQANTEVSNLTTIKAGINNLYAAKGGNYAGLSTPIANQARIFPQNMNGGSYAPGASVQTAWGGAVTVTPATGTAPREFTIAYASVPEGVCLGLVSGAAGNFKDVTVGGGSTGGTGGSTSGVSVMDSNGQFAPATAAIECGKTGPKSISFLSN